MEQKYIIVTVRLTDAAAKVAGKTYKTFEMRGDINRPVDFEKLYKIVPREHIVSYNFIDSFRNAKVGEHYLMEDKNGVEHIVKILYKTDEYNIYTNTAIVTDTDTLQRWYIKSDRTEQSKNKKKARIIMQLTNDEVAEIEREKNKTQENYVEIIKLLTASNNKEHTIGKYPLWFNNKLAKEIKELIETAKSEFFSDEF